MVRPKSLFERITFMRTGTSQFSLSFLLSVVTTFCIAWLTYYVDVQLFMIALPAMAFSLSLWHLRRSAGMNWPSSVMLSVACGGCVASATIGVISGITANLTQPSSGPHRMWSGVFAFLIPAMIGGAVGLTVSFLLALFVCLVIGINLWLFNGYVVDQRCESGPFSKDS